MSTKYSHLRFPSGMTAEQVSKDAKTLRKQQPQHTHAEALDIIAKKNLAPHGYKNGLKEAKRFSDFLEKRPNSPDLQYCVQCERIATVLDIFNIPCCGYHADIYREEDEIPPYKGEIPDGSSCFQEDCYQVPTKILGGACFCEEHFIDAKSGARYRRMLFNE